VIEQVIVVLRLLQYAGAAVLFGTSLFFLYALPPVGSSSASARRWPKPVLMSAAALLAASSVAAIAAQASLFTGSWRSGVTREAIGAVVSSMGIGKAAVVRAGVALLGLALLAGLPRGRAAWLAATGTGMIAAASLAWMGHAAATEGPMGIAHLAADAIHALAAAAWIGALVALVALAVERDDHGARRATLHRALLQVSVVGPALVVAVVMTGLVNAWILIGVDNFGALTATAYGQALLIKLALVAAMLGLAAANRLRFTADAAQPGVSLARLRCSLVLETGTGLAVLAVAAWLGTLVPPAST
jgi:putative copper resistance protein D